MQRYLEKAILFDAILIIIIGVALYFFTVKLELLDYIPKAPSISQFNVSLITVSATLIGFLLTIITVIITFRKSFDDGSHGEIEKKLNYNEIPEETIFEKVITKEQQFYNSPIHKKVVHVFVNATYETGIILLALLIIQFDIIDFSTILSAVVHFCLFTVLVLSVVRSLYIFKLFLNIHLETNSNI